MGRSRSKVLSIAIGICAASAMIVAVSVAVAQQQAPQKPRPQAPIKPYQMVATTLPTTVNDPTFDEFRRQLGEIAVKKDKARLARLVVAQGFFWRGEKGERADKNKSGMENLAAAIQLNANDDSGWDQLASYAYDPTAAPIASIKDLICSPADPVFNDKEFEALLKATQTDLEDWGYPLLAGIEVRSTRLSNAPVIDMLGLHFVRVLIDENSATIGPNQLPALQVVTPSGKTGYIPAFALAPLGNDQICYRKEADGWKIIGYIGGDQ
jgi:hypothetical protein